MGWGVDAMLWTAERVAALPGAVLRIPAMPTAAFLLMIAGGLWLALWQTRWRLAGAALIAAGLALAPTLRLPDLLVGAMARSSRCARRAGSYRRLGEDARRSSSGAGSNTTAISARRRKRARLQASSAMQWAAGRGSRD